MNESFGSPLDPPEGTSAGTTTENAEAEGVSGVEALEFNPDRIDRERLRTAIEIAQAEEVIAPKRFAENHNKQIDGMNEEELRTEIERAERNNNEAEVVRLEKLLLNRDNRGPIESVNQTEENPSEILEETTQATEEVSSENEEVVPEKEGKGERGGTYAERLSALANEKDPLGLAHVALREALETLGTTEMSYMKAGPFEELVASDKLDVVREFEAFKDKMRKNTEVSERDFAVHLKGLIYDRIIHQSDKVPESIFQDEVNDAREENPEENEEPEDISEIEGDEPSESEISEEKNETSASKLAQESQSELSDTSPEDAEVFQTPEEQPQDIKQEQQEVDPAPSVQVESSEVEKSTSAELVELKENGLLARVMQVLRESAHDRLKNADDRADDRKIDQTMDFFDKQANALFSEGKEGENARVFIYEILSTYLSETDLPKVDRDTYKKVLNALSQNEPTRFFEKAA